MVVGQECLDLPLGLIIQEPIWQMVVVQDKQQSREKQELLLHLLVFLVLVDLLLPQVDILVGVLKYLEIIIQPVVVQDRVEMDKLRPQMLREHPQVLVETELK